jgi:hypothetical protein
MKIYDGRLRSIAVNNTTRVAYFLIGTAGTITFYLLDLVTLAKGIVAATTLFIIHETLQSRIECIANFVIEKSLITKSDGDTLGLLGVVIVDFLIVTPLFSPKDYVWPYTVVLITNFTFFVLFYISLTHYQREIIQKVQQVRDDWYWYKWIFLIVALGDLVFVYQNRFNSALQIAEILFTPAPVAIEQAEYPILFMFSTICVLCTLLAMLIIGTFIILWLCLIVLIIATPLIVLTSPELLHSGLGTMPSSVRYWGAFAAITFTIISVMPEVLDLQEAIGENEHEQ